MVLSPEHPDVRAAPSGKSVRLISSPFHDGLEEFDRGRGPSRLLETARLAPAEIVGPINAGAPEAARVFELARHLADRVEAAIAEGVFPLVVAGDCNSCLGTVAGCGTRDLGVVWFDAHADFDTAEESLSGSLDAMGLALLTGDGWRALRESVRGLAPVEESNIVLVGARDLKPGQRARLDRSQLRWLEGNHFAESDLRAAVEDLRGRVGRVYLHIDLDVLDPSQGIANQHSAPAGLTTAQLLAAIAQVFERFDVAAAALTAYNPDSDTDGQMAATATRLLTALTDHARRDFGGSG